MATVKWCAKHGRHTAKVCPKCKPPKVSKKYGKVRIHIPPHMKAS